MHAVHAPAVAVSLVAVLAACGRPAATPSAPPRRLAAFVSRPLAFEANAGQTDPRVRFLARGAGGTAFVTDTEAVLAAPAGALRIRPVSDATPAAEGVDELPGKANYFIGSDPARWRTDVPTFARVRCAGVWSGIDLVWHASDGGRLEYDFVVAPGADPSQIAVEFAGADNVRIDERGDVVAHAGGAEFRQPVPVVYEETDGARRTVEGRYVMEGADRVRFAVAGRDPSRTLFIDPVVYATYLGGNDASGGLERILGIAKDTQGNTYVCGGTTSADFPLAGAVQGTYGGGGAFTRGDAFVTKIDPTGHTVLYSTYLGGAQDDEAYGIAVDGSGSAYVASEVYSNDFPTTAGSVQPASAGGADGSVTKLSPSGSALAYSTYLGSSSSDGLYGIAVDGPGAAYVCGGSSGSFPTTAGAVQPNIGGGTEDGVVAKLTPAGDALVYATFLGGSSFERATGIVVTASGEACVNGYTASLDFPIFPAQAPSKGVPGPKIVPVGTAFQSTYGGGSFDGFVTRLDAAGDQYVFSTYLGGSGEDYAADVSLDAAGNLYVPGYTTSTDFPTVSPVQAANGGGRDAILVKFSATGAALWSTYLGGTGDEIGYATATTPAGVTWMTGYTGSADFPTVNASRTTLGGGTDAFLARIGTSGTAFDVVTYVGGSGNDYGMTIVLDAAGDPLLGGQTSSTDLATTPGAFQSAFAGGNDDAFLSTAPGAPAIASFFLPKRIVATQNAKTPAKSKLIAAGYFDLGPGEPDLTKSATLDVGGFSFAIPGLALKGRNYVYAQPGMDFTVFSNPARSSRARFRVRTTGDLTGKIDLNGPLTLKFTSGDVKDATGVVNLTAGRYAIGRIRGALVAPNLYLSLVKTVLKGGGKDSLTIVLGLATNGATPASVPDLTIAFGPTYAATIPAASFVKKGDKFVFKGTAGGVTSATIDYVRETITVSAKNVDLGAFAQGPAAVTVGAALGANAHAVSVRMVRTGAAFRY